MGTTPRHPDPTLFHWPQYGDRALSHAEAPPPEEAPPSPSRGAAPVARAGRTRGPAALARPEGRAGAGGPGGARGAAAAAPAGKCWAPVRAWGRRFPRPPRRVPADGPDPPPPPLAFSRILPKVWERGEGSGEGRAGGAAPCGAGGP